MIATLRLQNLLVFLLSINHLRHAASASINQFAIQIFHAKNPKIGIDFHEWNFSRGWDQGTSFTACNAIIEERNQNPVKNKPKKSIFDEKKS